MPRHFISYLCLHRDCTPRLLSCAEGLTRDQVELGQDEMAAKVRRMVGEVRLELHRMKAFVRLKPAGNGIHFGFLKPRHRIGPLVAAHLARRLPGTIVVLGNSRESWRSVLDGGTICQAECGPLEEVLREIGCSLDGGAEDLWNAYYRSQQLKGRGTKGRRRSMPASSQKAVGNKAERGCHRLDEFR